MLRRCSICFRISWISICHRLSKQTTSIGYTLPKSYTLAKIILIDKVGKVLKEINITGNEKGSLTVDASTLAGGVYNYSLNVNGKLINTKQMVSVK